MSSEITVTAPVEKVVADPDELKIDMVDVGAVAEPPTAAQVQAAEDYFRREQESGAVAGLMGLWTSTLLLRDLAAEHFGRTDDEDEEKRQKPRLTDGDEE
jgi:hypothetical protein